MLLLIPSLTGSDGIRLQDITISADHDLVVRKILTRMSEADSEQYKLLAAPIDLKNDQDALNPAGIVGLQMTLLRKDPAGAIILQDSHILDIPVASVAKNGLAYTRQNMSYEDGIFTDITKAPFGDYQYTLTPDGGAPVTVSFSLDNNGVNKQVLVVGPPWVIVPPPSKILKAAQVVSLRAKLIWVTPDALAP
jgi:hypothetical protein